MGEIENFYSRLRMYTALDWIAPVMKDRSHSCMTFYV